MSYLNYQKKTIELVKSSQLDDKLIELISGKKGKMKAKLSKINKEFLEHVDKHFEVYRNEETRLKHNPISKLKINVGDVIMDFSCFTTTDDIETLHDYFYDNVEYGIYNGDELAKKIGSIIEIELDILSVGKDMYSKTMHVASRNKEKFIKIIKNNSTKSKKGIKQIIKDSVNDDELLDDLVDVVHDVENITNEQTVAIICQQYGINLEEHGELFDNATKYLHTNKETIKSYIK